METLRFAIQAESRFVSPPSSLANDSMIASLSLFLCFTFILITILLSRQTHREAAQLKAQRQLLERIWKASSNMEH